MGQNIVDTILLDSTVLIDLSRENEEAIGFIDTLRKNDQETAISVISSITFLGPRSTIIGPYLTTCDIVYGSQSDAMLTCVH